MSAEAEAQKPIQLSQLNWRDYLAMKNYNKDADKMCGLCRKEQIDKYGKITIPCKGLAEVPETIKQFGHLNTDELDLVRQIYDPYFWALKNIKESVFKYRWYQELMARCTAPNLVSRQGRRAGKSRLLALRALHRMFIKPNTKILMLAPQETQVKEFFEILDEFTFGFKPEFTNPTEFRKESRKKPYYEINYSNGSRFRGLIASNDATTVRGQAADVILLDEVDYIPEEALTAIVAIRLDNPNVELWVASTPSGKKALYKYESDPSYKTFHFPSFVIPHYTDALDAELRSQYGEGIGYVQEVLAEYGADEASVFQPFFIDRCIEPQEISEMRNYVLSNRNRFIVILGVDWNDDKNGTRLVSVAFDKQTKKFHTADALTVSKVGWTQTEAAETLTELNRTYNYDKIYVDEGFGVSTVQFIKKYAMSQFGVLPIGHPDLKLVDIVPINLSSKLELRDAETNLPIKKDMKSFMVENAVRYLERLAFRFDKTYDKELIKEMENYGILGTAPSGKKNYGPMSSEVGDHSLDAWMFALLGFTLEYQAESARLGAGDLFAVVTREAVQEESINPLYSTMNVNTKSESSFNNLYVPFGIKDVRERSNQDFYSKYVLNSRYNLERGLQRTISRSQIKK